MNKTTQHVFDAVSKTEDVTVHVMAYYDIPRSQPCFQSNEAPHFYFTLEIMIINTRESGIMLRAREWHIVDPIGGDRSIDSESFQGKGKVLCQGEVMPCGLGLKMRADYTVVSGFYEFIDLRTRQVFHVDIPTIELMYPGRQN